MGNGYFGTSQARKDKRKTKDFTYNYVDRIRLAEGSLQDQNYPVRGSGWRHKSVSHLDLATSCHGAASGPNHWPTQRQLRPSRSLDYSHIDRCKDALDIAEYHIASSRIDPEEHYDSRQGGHKAGLHPSHYQHRDVALFRDCAGESYRSTNSICSPQQQQQEQQQQQHHRQLLDSQIQPFDVGNDSCSLRRSRSLAVIREETFSDLQIPSTNSGRRRSQLIPRARLVNRGFFREHEARFNCVNNKHHPHHSSREKLTNDTEQDAPNSASSAAICDPHHHSAQHHQHHHPHHHNHHQTHHKHHHQHREAEDYYDNLKRLDAASAGGEHLHPWHNDKSDLESLNSDYFKNSLHQSHELKQQKQFHQQQLQQQPQQQHQHQQQQQQLQLEKEPADNTTTLSRSEKTRIYQSKRQQRLLAEKHTSQIQQQASKLQAPNSADSCPETSQSSVFPGTTTSNSDDQTDSLSCSEQEYDLARIEALYHQTKLEQDDEESYELISLTTTTRTRIETSEDEDDEGNSKPQEELPRPHSTETTSPDNEIQGTLKRTRSLSENFEKLIAYDSVYLSSEESSGSTIIEGHTEVSENLDAILSNAQVTRTKTKTTLLHISIEDTVFDSPLHSCGEHQSEDDVVNEEDVRKEVTRTVQGQNTNIETPKPSDNKEKVVDIAVPVEPPLYTQILDLDHSTGASLFATTTATVTSIPAANTSSAATKPRILAVVEKRKLKRAADCLNSASNDHQQAASGCGTRNGVLKNKFKANLIQNQYHSLPDVNIGKSLKVSERIDAKLRSSYNVNNYQPAGDDVSNYRPIKSKVSVVPLNQKGGAEVTAAEINDSIKKFGQEHQKARLQEYEDLYEETIIREEIGVREKKKPCLEKSETNAATYTKEIKVIEEERKRTTDKPTNSSTVEIHELCLESTSEINVAKTVSTAGTEVLDYLAEHSSESEQKTDTNEYEEQPKEAPSIEVPHFTREIERRAKEIKQIAADNKAKQKQQAREEEFQSQTFTSATFRISKSVKNFPQPVFCGNGSEATANPFRIIVTDAHNNVIEEDSIEGQHTESISSSTTSELAQIGTVTASDKVEQIPRIQIKDLAQNRGKSSIPSHKKTTSSSLKRIPSKPKRTHISGQQYHYHSNQDAEFANQKSKERRVLSTQIYKARPVKVLTANDSFRRAAISTKMSRPQILHVVDNKRDANVGPATGRAAGSAIINSLTQIGGNEVENEYMKKVDAVRCYWSKLAQNEQEQGEEEKQEREAVPVKKKEQQQEELQARQHQQLLATGNSGTHSENHQAKHLSAQQETRANNPSKLDTKKPGDFSFMPSIEIVELDGEKTAAIVSAVSPIATADSLSNEAKEPQFDHIRYKVMKSQQLLRTNILARHKKEAQFDGLIQYLQDYSFQELLSNNNVVIVEPVRTKIERPSQTVLKTNANGTYLGQSKVALPSKAEETSQLPAKLAREETNDTSKNVPGSENKQSSGIKRHFFYQPVRVNRELYEEELPHPDTVRNVRKFFEENVLPTPERGIAVQRCRLPNSNSATHREGVQEYPQLSPRSSRVRKYRYLTIDTSYGHSGEEIQSPQPHGARKWDSASLSSGISSGDLSSPCECIEVDASVPGQLTTETSGVEQQRYLSRANELKGVHVKDVVRRHNTTNEGERHVKDVNADVGVNGKSRRLRPQSILRENIYYRNIHEYNASQCYGAMESNCRQSRHSGQDGNDMFVDEDEEDVDDEDDELSESYYVSNDILEKIREYGSSVTYYGGRVFQKTSPDPVNQSSHGNCNHGAPGVATLNPSASTITLTRVRAKDLETCGDCQTNKCPQDEHLKDKFKDRTAIEQRKNEVSSVTRSSNNDAYWGVKFKLIKSNSCSSRLELAGTEEDVHLAEAPTEDTDVVRDIVKRLEATKDTKQKDNRVNKSSKQANRNTEHNSSGESALTINNQMTSDATLLPQVTVNNHINVAIPAAPSPHLNTMKISKTLTAEEPCSSVVGDQKETGVQREKTFESSALNIRLDVAEGKYHKDTKCNETNSHNRKNNHHNNTANGTTKICRNKNVDLAFIMTRQQQTHRSTGPTKESRKSSSFQPTLQSTLEHTHVEKVTQHLKNASEQSKVNELINTSGPNKCAIKTLPADMPMKSNTSTTGDTTRVTVTDPKKSVNIPDHSLDTNMRNGSPKPINKSTTKLTVPVEIHQRTVQYTEPTRITVGEDKSSTQATIGKTFVRHYVANDKSLLERRKYDDIEFEEFEVYDPSKDVDRLMSSGGDGNKPQRTSSVSDLSSLNDDVK